MERRADAAKLYATGARRREYRDPRLEWMIKSGGIEAVLAGLRDGNIRFPWPEASWVRIPEQVGQAFRSHVGH